MVTDCSRNWLQGLMCVSAGGQGRLGDSWWMTDLGFTLSHSKCSGTCWSCHQLFLVGWQNGEEGPTQKHTKQSSLNGVLCSGGCSSSCVPAGRRGSQRVCALGVQLPVRPVAVIVPSVCMEGPQCSACVRCLVPAIPWDSHASVHRVMRSISQYFPGGARLYSSFQYWWCSVGSQSSISPFVVDLLYVCFIFFLMAALKVFILSKILYWCICICIFFHSTQLLGDTFHSEDVNVGGLWEMYMF